MRKDKTIPLGINLSDEQRNSVSQQIVEKSKDGRLSCSDAWSIAQDLDVPLAVVGHVTDQLQIRISRCQLGCF